MSDGGATSYDEIPYESFALPETHPDRLSALARLFGLTPPGLEGCRVVELGCASGGNLIPMALALPRARFLGVDLSRRQVEQGREMIADLGLENIELRAMDLRELDPGLGPFDFVLCHGVYSWVPEDVQEAILRLCAEALAPEGIAYVSYNTYPGWHLREMVREMMRHHARHADGPAGRLRAGRALLEALAGAVDAGDDPYSHCVRDEAAQLLPKPDYYLLHEHFEDLNNPIYFHQFLEQATGHGLQFLAEARFGSMAAAQQPEVAALMGDLSPDPGDREQLCDFLAGRRFRQTLLCRDGIALSREPSPEAVMALRVSGTPNVPPEPTDADPTAPEVFHSLDGRTALTTADPLVRAMMRALRAAWPRSLPFAELWDRTRARLTRGEDAGSASAAHGPAELARAVLEGLREGVVELHVWEPGFAAAANERPLGSPLARRQVRAGPRVTNLAHHLVDLNDLDRLVLYHLDGRHDREGLLDALQAAVARGDFRLQVAGRPPISDPAEARPLLARLLEPSLQRLAGFALLVG